MGKENKTRDAIDAVTGLVKAVPVYKDLVQPAAKEVGVGLQKTVQLALAPISGLVWGFDKIKDFVGTSVAKRLEKIPENQIKTPLPQIAGPALEALKYTGHDENLREMFAKLIATSMDEATAVNAHPSFVEIIRQLNADEAMICRLLKNNADWPIANIHLEEQDGFRDGIRHFSTLGYLASCQFPKLIQRYLDNLERLGLIKIDFDRVFAEKNKYVELESHADFVTFLDDIKKSGQKSKTERGVISRTIFGKHFLDACVD